jgi:hypothetical protein
LTALLVNTLLLSILQYSTAVMARPALKNGLQVLLGPAIERGTYVLPVESSPTFNSIGKWQPITTTVWKAKMKLLLLF